MYYNKILVTGGAGYIGSHTIIALVEAGFDPIIIDDFSTSSPAIVKGIEKITKKKIKLYQIDCKNKKAVSNLFQKEKNIQGVIHFAAYKSVEESTKNPLSYYDNNINTLLNFLENFIRYNISYFIFSSSCTVYGQPSKLPVTENLSTIAVSPYGNTKKIGEEIINDLVYSKAPIKSISLRYFNPIGAHSSGLIGEFPIHKPTNLVPYIMQTGIGMRKKLPVFGNDYNTSDGTCIRDYIHVMDLAEAHVTALSWLMKKKEKSFYDTFNIGMGKGISVLEIIQAFEKITGKKLPYEIKPRRAGDIEKIYASTKKATSILKWKPKRSLVEGLQDAWNWQLALEKIKR